MLYPLLAAAHADDSTTAKLNWFKILAHIRRDAGLVLKDDHKEAKMKVQILLCNCNCLGCLSMKSTY